MAKLASTSTYCATFYILLLTSGMLVGMVGGEMCNEDMGEYDYDCETKCEAAHAGGQACCFIGSGGVRVCTCNYKCPQGGTCRVSLGVWGWGGSGCRDSECNDLCVAAYLGGHGYCYTLNLILAVFAITHAN